MRIQDETDCHLSRLSRSLMTRTAFGRVLTPAVQAPGIETPGFIISFFFRVPPLPRVPVCTAPTYTRAPLSLSLPPCIVSPLSSCFPLLFPRCSCLRDGWIRFVRINKRPELVGSELLGIREKVFVEFTVDSVSDLNESDRNEVSSCAIDFEKL